MIDFTVGEESLIADPGVEIILKGGAKEEVQKHRIAWTYHPTPPNIYAIVPYSQK